MEVQFFELTNDVICSLRHCLLMRASKEKFHLLPSLVCVCDAGQIIFTVTLIISEITDLQMRQNDAKAQSLGLCCMPVVLIEHSDGKQICQIHPIVQ